MTTSETLGEVYEDRNALALAFAKLVHKYRLVDLSVGYQSDTGFLESNYRALWQPDQGDDADADEWAILYVELPTGQASWHVPKQLVESTSIPRQNHVEWDGHTREEKNDRLQEFADG